MLTYFVDKHLHLRLAIYKTEIRRFEMDENLKKKPSRKTKLKMVFPNQSNKKHLARYRKYKSTLIQPINYWFQKFREMRYVSVY